MIYTFVYSDGSRNVGAGKEKIPESGVYLIDLKGIRYGNAVKVEVGIFDAKLDCSGSPATVILFDGETEIKRATVKQCEDFKWDAGAR